MAAAVGTDRTIPFKVNTGVKVGQGPTPEVVVRVSFSDVAAYPTVWTDITSRVRSFGWNRGRGSEQQQHDAGTATVEVWNTDRLFDPTYNPSARPMNQLWIQEQFSSETNDCFKGWVDAYDQGWEMFEGVATITATDELKVLSLDALPVTDPPRDSYEEVVMWDLPDGYWRFNDPSETRQLAGTVGNTLFITGSLVAVGAADNPIVGDNGGLTGTGYYKVDPGNQIEAELPAFDTTTGTEWNATGDVSWLAEATVEMWVKPFGIPASFDYLCQAITSTGTPYVLGANSSGLFSMNFQDWYGTQTNTVTGGPPGGFMADTWYHVVMTVTGNYARLYVNAQQVASFNFGTTFGPVGIPSLPFRLNSTANTASWGYDEVAFYRKGLTPDRIMAHYQAALQRGFPAAQNPGVRVNQILDSVTSRAPRSVMPGSQTMRGAFMHGQPPLDELRKCAQAELPDGMLFVNASGAITFLDTNHQNVSPWNTVQATYGDEGTAGQLPYNDVDIDYSESFLTNEWNLTREGGKLQTWRNQESIDRYFKRSQSLTDLPLMDDTTVSYIASQLLWKYRVPTMRIQSLSLVTANPDVILETFRLELADRIRLIRTVSGGWIDRQLFVERIDVTGAPGQLWTITLGVSDAAFVFQPITDKYTDFNGLTAAYPDFDHMSNTDH